MPELIGQLIDVVEDFLEEKGVDIENDEKLEDGLGEESHAIIYGSDYGALQDDFKAVLENWFDIGESDRILRTQPLAVQNEIERRLMISFECISNTDVPWINTAKFITDKGEITIDRNHTEYGYNPVTRTLLMHWKLPYIWDGEEANYDIPEDFFEHAVLKELEVEDDAPAGYEIKCIHCCVEGVENQLSEN